jgi:uncharacterized protein DUF5916
VQADGTLIETQAGSRDTVDFSADFVYQSQGRLTATGFEVEIPIPSKSIRYQSQAVQQWGLNVVRQVQRSGHRATWTAARLTAASFLAQSGTLTGRTDLRRGLVLDLIPELTAKIDGAPDAAGWTFGATQPGASGNLHWGVTTNLTLIGAARPDFSQVEADAEQLVFDPREALFFPEKRPFFLEGLEQFNTPNSLVYTRRLVQPVAAIKLTARYPGSVSACSRAWTTARIRRAGPTIPSTTCCGYAATWVASPSRGSYTPTRSTARTTIASPGPTRGSCSVGHTPRPSTPWRVSAARPGQRLPRDAADASVAAVQRLTPGAARHSGRELLRVVSGLDRLHQAGLDWRPSDRIRVNATYLQKRYWRKTDGSTVGRDMVPRVKVEYQVTRSLFLRAVGQYATHWQDSLRDDSRTNDPILIRDPQTGAPTPARRRSRATPCGSTGW